VIPVPSLLLRAALPVVVGTEVFLSLIELPIREDLLELIRLPELPACGCVLRTLCLFVPIEPPIREDLSVLIRLVESPACGCVVLRTLGVLVLIILPISELLLELIRFPELPICGCVLPTLGVLVLIELPIREDLSVRIRLVELPACGLVVLRTLDVIVLIMLPIRELLLELIRFPELPICGCVLPTLGVLVPIELPIREDLSVLIRLPELADVCFPAPELIVVGFLLPIVMLEGSRVLEVIPGCLVTGWLTVILLGLARQSVWRVKLVTPVLGMRMLNLVVLPGPVLRSELLRKVELLNPEGLAVLILAGDLMDRNEVEVLEELDLVLEGCRALEAEEDLETCWLLALLGLDLRLLLLLDFLSAKAGSKNSIRAKTSVRTAILTFFWYFSVAIIRLLSIFYAITVLFETSSTY